MHRLPRHAKLVALQAIYEDDHFAVDETELFDLLPDADDAHADNDGSVSEDGDVIHSIGENEDDIMPRDALEDLESNESNSDSEEEMSNSSSDGAFHTAKNGLQWSSEPMVSESGRFHQANIIRERCGPKIGIHPQTEKEAFFMYTTEIFDEIVRYTNLEGRRKVREINQFHVGQRKKVWKDIDRDEMEAFVGLHFIIGAYKAHYRNVHELFSKRDGHPICRATMSKERFCVIKQMFRMDDRRRRDANDPLAPMGRILDLLQDKLNEYFVPGSHITIDEQLMEFHGRVRFRQYVASKPGKFGIKIFWACDSATGFALRFVVYVGQKTLTENERALGELFSDALVLKMTAPWHNSGRGFVVDNWFTSIPLAEKLLEKKTTLLGTMRSNRKGLPEAAKVTAGRQPKSALHFYRPNMMLTSYKDKGTGNVLLLSTEHRIGTVVDGKPNLVVTYNSTKSGVDNLDHMVRLFSCKRKCQRWPYELFFNFLDVAAINAYILKNYHLQDKRTNERYHFLLNLGYSLAEPFLRRRQSCSLPATVKEAMAHCGYPCPPILKAETVTKTTKRGRCVMCPRASDKKVNDRCTQCHRFVCKQHSGLLCIQCSE